MYSQQYDGGSQNAIKVLPATLPCSHGRVWVIGLSGAYLSYAGFLGYSWSAASKWSGPSISNSTCCGSYYNTATRSRRLSYRSSSQSRHPKSHIYKNGRSYRHASRAIAALQQRDVSRSCGVWMVYDPRLLKRFYFLPR